MNILVCIKPNVESADISYNPTTGAPLLPATSRLAASDAAALQLALDLKTSQAATVIVVSVAGNGADPFLRQALQLGADRAVRLWQDDTAGRVDTWTAANVAAGAATKLDANLVLCGAQSEDLGDEYFAVALAAAAEFALVARAISVTRGDDGVLEAVQKLEGGWRIGHRLERAAVIAVDAEIARPRHNTMLGRAYRDGLARSVETWTPADAGLVELPAALVEEVELALPRARAKAVVPQATKVSARDRLRRKKKTADPESTQQTLQGSPDSVAEQLLGQFEKWLT